MKIKRLIDNVFNNNKFISLIDDMELESKLKIKSSVITYIIMTRSTRNIHILVEELINLINNSTRVRYDNYTNYIIDFINEHKIVDNKDILDNYITHGYYFHTYNSVFNNSIKTYGLNSNKKIWNDDELLEIKNIFNKKGKTDTFGLYKKDNPIYLDTSPTSSSYYALISPSWFMHFATGGFNNDKNYYKNAYINNNYEEMLYNVNKMIYDYKLDEEEKNKVLNFFDKYYKLFCKNKSSDLLLVDRNKIDDNILYFNDNYNINDVKRIIGLYSSGVKICKQNIDKDNLIFINYNNRMERVNNDKYKRR